MSQGLEKEKKDLTGPKAKYSLVFPKFTKSSSDSNEVKVTDDKSGETEETKGKDTSSITFSSSKFESLIKLSRFGRKHKKLIVGLAALFAIIFLCSLVLLKIIFKFNANKKPNIVEKLDTRPRFAYQVDVGTFQDSNGDGLGDLAGVIKNMDHFIHLGITDIVLTGYAADTTAQEEADLITLSESIKAFHNAKINVFWDVTFPLAFRQVRFVSKAFDGFFFSQKRYKKRTGNLPTTEFIQGLQKNVTELGSNLLIEISHTVDENSTVSAAIPKVYNHPCVKGVIVSYNFDGPLEEWAPSAHLRFYRFLMTESAQNVSLTSKALVFYNFDNFDSFEKAGHFIYPHLYAAVSFTSPYIMIYAGQELKQGRYNSSNFEQAIKTIRENKAPSYIEYFVALSKAVNDETFESSRKATTTYLEGTVPRGFEIARKVPGVKKEVSAYAWLPFSNKKTNRVELTKNHGKLIFDQNDPLDPESNYDKITMFSVHYSIKTN